MSLSSHTHICDPKGSSLKAGDLPNGETAPSNDSIEPPKGDRLMFSSHPIYSNYCADEYGNIFHIDRPTSPLFQTTLNSGYKDVHFPIANSKRQKHYLVHRFTYECYHGIVPKNMDVHHKDGDRTNNCIDNLEPVSHKINVQLRHGYKGKKFEHLDKLPDDATPITKVKKNEFDNLYYVPSTNSFYVQTHDVYVKKVVDKDNRIHVMKTDGKYAHHKVNVIKKLLTHL